MRLCVCFCVCGCVWPHISAFVTCASRLCRPRAFLTYLLILTIFTVSVFLHTKILQRLTQMLFFFFFTCHHIMSVLYALDFSWSSLRFERIYMNIECNLKPFPRIVHDQIFIKFSQVGTRTMKQTNGRVNLLITELNRSSFVKFAHAREKYKRRQTYATRRIYLSINIRHFCHSNYLSHSLTHKHSLHFTVMH